MPGCVWQPEFSSEAVECKFPAIANSKSGISFEMRILFILRRNSEQAFAFGGGLKLETYQFAWNPMNKYEKS
jgi:hypothetical protein